MAPYPQLTPFTCSNAIYWGSYSVSISVFCLNPNSNQLLFIGWVLFLSPFLLFVQIPIQLNSYLGGKRVLLCFHLPLHILFTSQPNPFPTYEQWEWVLLYLHLCPCFFFKSPPSSIPIYRGMVLLCVHLYLWFLFKSKPNSIPIYDGRILLCLCYSSNSIPIYGGRDPTLFPSASPPFVQIPAQLISYIWELGPTWSPFVFLLNPTQLNSYI